MSKSKTRIHKTLSSPARDKKGPQPLIFSPVKFTRSFQCLTASSAAIPPQLSVLVPFSCLQPFGTQKLDAPPPMSPGLQSSRCLLENLGVYWQH